MSGFEVGKAYGYSAFPGTAGNMNSGFVIKQKLGKFMIATCGGDYDHSTHVFDANGKHLSDYYGNSRTDWQLILRSKKVQYKTVRVDGTTSDWITPTSPVSFTSTVVGGFVRVDGGVPIWRASRLTLKDEVNSYL